VGSSARGHVREVDHSRRSWHRARVGLRSALEAAGARRRRAAALRFYRTLVPPAGLCFDVGANLGERTDLFVALGARVVAVEPQTRCADILRRRFGGRIHLVEAALGPEPGTAELLVASYHTLSSLSPEWVEAVQESGRFAEFDWGDRVVVPVTTLDELIATFGVPEFCKIDVEGFELEVLRGLTRAIPAISFEFTFERIESRLQAVAHLDRLGMTRFNFSNGETFELALKTWVDRDAIQAFLRSLPKRVDVFGDVYALG
jgi:FkbM family methyltransferase